MDATEDADPDEMVTWEEKSMTLREAVADYRVQRRPGMLGPAVFRGPGKEPFIFTQEHLDYLMQLPEFQPDEQPGD
jgi:hypothetical protein